MMMTTAWPIFIPSKGRPKSRLVAATSGVATVVVEPQEADDYRAINPHAKIALLPESDRGIAFARNFILAKNRAMGVEWFWMLDDDITSFHINRKGAKPEKCSATQALSMAQNLVPKDDVGQVALEYQQFAWSGQKIWTRNSYCDVAVAINVKHTKRLTYRSEMVLKEDRDFTLQVLASGRSTLRLGKVGFTAPKNGSNAGGLADLYGQQGREELAVQRMVAAWPAVCRRQVKRDGRVDCKINWAAFK